MSRPFAGRSVAAELPIRMLALDIDGTLVGDDLALRERTRATIVNPIRLTVSLRNDICYSCHMQPTVTLAGIRRFGRSIQSFRPGQALTDYLSPVDIDDEEISRSERFEINHHPYRLEQSACFKKSAGALSCLTCHDPHRKVPVEARPAQDGAVHALVGKAELAHSKGRGDLA